MSIDPHARKILDQYGIEVVRAKYIKEIAVTGDTEEELNKEMVFGNEKVRVRDVAQWFGVAAKKSSRWAKVGPVLSLFSVFIAVAVLVVALRNLSYTTSNYDAQNRSQLQIFNLYLPAEPDSDSFIVTVLNKGNEDATKISMKFAAIDLRTRTVTPLKEEAWPRLATGTTDRVTFKIPNADTTSNSKQFLRICFIYSNNTGYDDVGFLPLAQLQRGLNYNFLFPSRPDADILTADFSCRKG